MAVSYDAWKKGYESLNDQEKQQYNDRLKSMWDDTYNQYMKQYQQAQQPQQTTQQSNFNNQNGTNWGNQQNFNTPTIQKTENQTPKQTQTYNYDPNEQLDTNMFKSSDWKVRVQEWSAQQTGKPDYTLDTDARMKEITDNLNAYWQTNREYFSDRNTYNNMFHYNERNDQQKAVLDSYWKKKEDMDTAMKYTSGDALSGWMNNAEITPEQLNYIKDYSPEAYREWQQKQQDDINLRIANLATPADPTDNAELFSSLAKKLNLEPGDPYQIYDNWYDMCERLGVFSDSQTLKSYQNQLDANHSKMESIMWRYAASTWWTVSDALAAARMQKALAPYQQREVDLQNSYTALLNGRNSNLAIANQSANALAMQAAEDQRIFNQRLQGLNFAMQTASYRSPEQQAQLQLQTQQIQNDLSLLNQSMANDLNLYNQYETAKLNNRLQQELTDLSVEDEAQLKANLYNALSWYYEQYGDIIKRSQSQAVDDIIAYAKKNGISVAEALTQNFITPLQNKKEYKQKVAEDYGMNKYLQEYSYTIDSEGNVVMKASGFWEIPQEAFKSRASRQEAYSDVYNESLDWASYVTNLADCIKDWSYGGQCGAFVNDVLVAWDNNKVFGNSLQDKKDVMNVSKSEWPQVWYAAVFDLWYVSSDWVNHWHVWVVTSVNNDWSIDVLESNGKSDETIHVKRYSKADVDKKVLWYYKPTNYDISRDLEQSDTKQRLVLQSKFSSDPTWNENWYIESLAKDFEAYLEKWKAAINSDQWKALKENYGMDEKDFREMAQIYAKTWMKKQGVNQAETALKSALQLKDMLNSGKTLWIKDNPQKWLLDRAINQWIPWTDAGEAKAQYNTLMSQLELNALFTAKNNWASFGAMSDAEWQVLWNSATNLKWNSSWDTFEKNLNNLIAELSNVVSSGWWKLPQWVYNTDI